MLSATRSALLSTLLVAMASVPLGALASIQHSAMPLDKRQAASDGSECWTDYAKKPECTMLQVSYFEDAECRKPLGLFKADPNAMIKDNTQMVWDGALTRSLKKSFGSLRVVGAVPGFGLGFAREAESDTVVQNMAWMSAAETYRVFQSKSCVTFPNLDASKIGVWSVRAETSLNSDGYVWNPFNVPLKNSGYQCNKRRRSVANQSSASSAVCLEGASWGGGGVLELYTTENCTPDPKDKNSVKRQLYSTVQCTPLSMTNYKSFKAIAPSGITIDPVFSPVYYDLGQQSGYHACAQKDVSSAPFKPNACQKAAGNDMFVGIYGNDPTYKQPVPGPGDKVLRKSHGNLLLGPGPHTTNPHH
ncbi:uncharacterized protein UTRI_00038_B [Ustilago trichophora]|uniref:Uncharacterized protein n=1 Tax=Ustilago trichophora TaxID=86804 RepID=A0A5C3DNL0_9BASI|nr:uncharacterized protein UTRI_00038_B [Ustilago trichophora]